MASQSNSMACRSGKLLNPPQIRQSWGFPSCQGIGLRAAPATILGLITELRSTVV